MSVGPSLFHSNMDLQKRFERRVDERTLARVLDSIGDPPNRRSTPVAGDVEGAFDFWFDGGAARVLTGYVEYVFTDGTNATVGASFPALSVVIEFANGCRVRVQQESWGTEGE